jgi:hypothetical protein
MGVLDLIKIVRPLAHDQRPVRAHLRMTPKTMN